MSFASNLHNEFFKYKDLFYQDLRERLFILISNYLCDLVSFVSLMAVLTIIATARYNIIIVVIPAFVISLLAIMYVGFWLSDYVATFSLNLSTMPKQFGIFELIYNSAEDALTSPTYFGWLQPVVNTNSIPSILAMQIILPLITFCLSVIIVSILISCRRVLQPILLLILTRLEDASSGLLTIFAGALSAVVGIVSAVSKWLNSNGAG